MGAGASIYSNMIRPPAQPENLVDMYTHALDLKTAMTRAQMAPVELQRQQEEAAGLHQKNQQAAEDAADQKTIQQVYGSVQNDSTIPPEKKHDELINQLAGKVKPAALTSLNKQIEDHDTALRKASDENLAQSLKKNTEVNNQMAAVAGVPADQQPAQWGVARQSLINQGIAKPEEIPETYDPASLAMHRAAAMGAVNSATAEISRREQSNKDADEARKARTDELATAGQTIDGVQDQAGYDAWRGKLSPANQALTAATFTPQNVATIKRMALTANQQREADQATATASETTRHNQAQEANAAAKPTYSGEMRAALVSVGADPDKATPDQAAAALKVLRPATTDKPASKATLVAIEQRKSKAITDSKAKLDKEIAGATISGKVIDQPTIDQAWQDHIERLQDAQTGYENALTTATGGDVGHNDWADRLRVPGQPPAPATAGPQAPAGAPPAPGPQASPNAPPAPNPAAKALVSKYKVGQQVKLRTGQTVTIKKIDPETGNFEY